MENITESNVIITVPIENQESAVEAETPYAVITIEEVKTEPSIQESPADAQPIPEVNITTQIRSEKNKCWLRVVSEDKLFAPKKNSEESLKRKTEGNGNGYDPGSPTSKSKQSTKKQAIIKVVSEDKLLASKKKSKESCKRKADGDGDGYDPRSPTSKSKRSTKKQAVAKMRTPEKIVPSEFLDLLTEEECDSEEDVFEEIENDQEDEVVAETRRDIRELNLPIGEHVYVVQADGSLVMAMPEPASGPAHSDTDEEEALARDDVLRAISPISPRSKSPQSAGLKTNGPTSVPESGTGSGGRGRGSGGRVRTGRGRGRGGSRVGGRRSRGSGSSGLRRGMTGEANKSRGNPLEEIGRLTNDRRERASRARRSMNVEQEDNGSDENERFFDSGEFVWAEMGDWNGVKETFVPETSGPTDLVDNAYDAFRSYWDDSLLSHIVRETNRYAERIKSERFQHMWFKTNIDELLVLFAFWMMLGIVKMPTIKSCFTKLSIMRTEIFRSMFVEDRYWNLNRAFQLADGSQQANDPHNALYSMGPILDQLNIKFQERYRLHQDICIDESLTLWKGPVEFKQYIKTKSARFGIKSYQLCESSTGYLWTFFIYVGRQTSTSTLPSSISTVLKLVQPILDLGHVLYVNSWFNSPLLARYLKRRKTDCVGTLRSSRLNIPPIVQRCPLAEGEFVARQSGDMMVVSLQDRKRLTCISTCHNTAQVQKDARAGRPAQYKLKLIDDYNRGMGGVDKMDQMLEPYLVERKQCTKWTRKLFKRLLNVSIQNARILLEKSTNTKIDSLCFRLKLVQSIIDKHRPNVPLRNPQAPSPRKYLTRPQFPAERLTERHFIRRITITAAMRESGTIRHRSNLGRRQCVWCTANGRKNSKTVYECPKCKVPLCLDYCFEQFHTIP